MSRWRFGRFGCQAITGLVVCLLSASIYNFVLVNLDRLLSLKFPLTYNNQSQTSIRIIKIGIVISCVAAFIPAVPMWVPEVHETRGELDGRWVDGQGTCVFPYNSVCLHEY